MAIHDVKAVAFDVDGTLINSSIWKTLHARFNFPDSEDARLLALYKEDAITFREWMDAVDALYLKASPRPSKKEVDTILHAFEFITGAKEVVSALSARYPIALISSGFTDYVQPVAEALSIPHAYSFMYVAYTKEGVYDGMRYHSEGTELEAKVSALKDFGEKVGALPHQIAFVGDSKNDLAAFQYTGKGILIGESIEEMHRAAWKRISNLSEIPDLL